jgi:D-alanine-D-alanine ligase
VTDVSQLPAALELASSQGDNALVEQCITGMEITVPVIGNDDPQALPIVEIVTGAEFYDLKVKYEPGELHHVIPARLSEDVYARAQELAISAHKALGCRGASRSDFIVTADGTPYILETNTIPGMTETSLLPDSARRAGIEFPELCRRFVEFALQ